MNKNFGLYFAVSSIIAWNVQASDDVFVDLSVLDNIPQDSIVFVSSEPLFPEVKVSQVKKKTVASAKKQQKKVVKVKKTKTIKPKVEKSTESNTVKEQNVENPFAQNLENQVVTTPENTAETSEVVKNDKDETLLQKNQLQETSVEPAGETVVSPQETSVTATEQEKINSSDMLDNTVKENPFAMPQNILPQSLTTENVLSAKVSEQVNALPNQPKEIYSIPFATDSSELSAEAQKKLEEVAQNLNKNGKKKISIKAYNYNDGTNAFYKKRISLNRATEIRSYLLNHGFKNFSIKIINTNTNNEYKDTVEIEEIN